MTHLSFSRLVSRRRTRIIAAGAVILLGAVACASGRTPTPATARDDQAEEAAMLASELLRRIDWKDVCPATKPCESLQIHATVYRAAPYGVVRDSTLWWFRLSSADLPVGVDGPPFVLTNDAAQEGSTTARVTLAVTPRESRGENLLLVAAQILSPAHDMGLAVQAMGTRKESSWRIARVLSIPY